MDLLVALGALVGLLWGIYEGNGERSMRTSQSYNDLRHNTRKPLRTDEEILQGNEEGRVLLFMGREYHQLKLMSLEILEQNRKATVVLDDMMRRLDELEVKLRQENYYNQEYEHEEAQFSTVP